ncbi:hypothetical protein AgCh_032989 [Apium graveolens]
MDAMYDVHNRFTQDLTQALGIAFRATWVDIQWPIFGEDSVYPPPDTPPAEGDDHFDSDFESVMLEDKHQFKFGGHNQEQEWFYNIFMIKRVLGWSLGCLSASNQQEKIKEAKKIKFWQKLRAVAPIFKASALIQQKVRAAAPLLRAVAPGQDFQIPDLIRILICWIHARVFILKDADNSPEARNIHKDDEFRRAIKRDAPRTGAGEKRAPRYNSDVMYASCASVEQRVFNEDAAIGKCDFSIHSINAHVSAHQRFLLTGVKVGLEPTKCNAPSSSEKSLSMEKIIETESRPLSIKSNQTSPDGQRNNGSSFQVAGLGDFVESTKMPFAGRSDYGRLNRGN